MLTGIKYSFLSSMRHKQQVSMSLLGTLVMATIFRFMLLPQIENVEQNVPIPVAVVGGENASFLQFLQQMPLVEISAMEMGEALEQLEREEVIGIFEMEPSLRLTLSHNGNRQRLLQRTADWYLQQSQVLEKMPIDYLEAARFQLEDAPSLLLFQDTEERLAGFLLTMMFMTLGIVPLTGSLQGLYKVEKITSKASGLTVRRLVSATEPSAVFIQEVIGSSLLQTVLSLVAAFYFTLVLNIGFGSYYALTGLLILAMNFFCIVSGMAIGLFVPGSLKVKEAFASLMGMFMGVQGMLSLQMQLPLLQRFDRFNPLLVFAEGNIALINSELDRYWYLIGVSLLATAVLALISLFAVRRKSHADL